ncbi:MAG: hydrogenase 4 subunit F [Firmicutes bacterium]|nr:hydrogenase 4 subunit F [Bacillota bacterium]
METLVLVIPFLTAALFWATNRRALLHIINGIGASLLLAMAAFITWKINDTGVINYAFMNGFFYLDALSVIVLDTILIVSFMVCIYAIGYLEREYAHQAVNLRRIKFFYSLTYIFIFTMILVVSTQNLGVMWIAIEATTLASAFLVGFYNQKESIEAAWKYVIICSVGIALALLGIVFLYYSSANLFAESKFNLNWAFLLENAGQLHTSILKIAFLFILIGFGAKAGLAPMHTWLPDAHSQAPSPISALLSGVLLNSALYGLVRILAIVNKNLGSHTYTGTLLIIVGLASITAAALFIITQKDYKRLLAYSSIEHMGIITFGLGIFTPLALFASLFHMLNHAFTKSLLFLSSGHVYLKYKTREIGKVNGVLQAMPAAGTVFFLGLFAIAGMPPFSVFASEFTMIMAAVKANFLPQAILFILLAAIVFAGIAATALKIFFPGPACMDPQLAKEDPNPLGTVAIVALLVTVLITGVYLPVQVKKLIEAAAGIVMN